MYLKFFLDAWDTLWLLLEVNCSPIKNSVFTEMESRCCAELDKAAGTKVHITKSMYTHFCDCIGIVPGFKPPWCHEFGLLAVQEKDKCF